MFVYEDYDSTIYEMMQNIKIQIDFYEKNQEKLMQMET